MAASGAAGLHGCGGAFLWLVPLCAAQVSGDMSTVT